jgi:hypothetical protein
MGLIRLKSFLIISSTNVDFFSKTTGNKIIKQLFEHFSMLVGTYKQLVVGGG